MAGKLRVDHRNFDMLHNHGADVSNRFPRVVGYNNVGSELLSMVVDFLVQCYFKTYLAIAESKTFAHK